jgi:hypothetical protein
MAARTNKTLQFLHMDVMRTNGRNFVESKFSTQVKRMLRFLLVLTCAAAAYGWGAQGHATVGAIADTMLSSTASSLVNDLLGGSSLQDVADWADDVKRNKDYLW